MNIEIKQVAKIVKKLGQWVISRIAEDDSGNLEIHVACEDVSEFACPKCGEACPVYDRRPRRWRHLDAWKYRTYLTTDLPRVSCPAHGVRTIAIPWADRSARVTYELEALVIDWLLETTVSAVSRKLGLSWTAVDGIMQRAVERGKSRKKKETVKDIGVDETSIKRGHNYITVVIDAKKGVVEYVGEGRKRESLGAYYKGLSPEQRNGIESVSMDMWPAYIRETDDWFPNAKEITAFDKFHVVKYIGEGVDTVRKQEHRALKKEGREDLTGTKYIWLTNEKNLSDKQRERFESLRDSQLETGRAWAIKETAKHLWNYSDRDYARKEWELWLEWVRESGLEPMIKAADTIRKHLWGIINAILLRVTNGPSEGMNSRIKMIKVRARGFRNTQRFINAIYFYLGGLNLYP